jgi:hypothetical protein
MSRADSFDFTLDEETEKRLYDLLTDMDTRNTNRFWITDKRGYHAEYAKVIRCKDCKYYRIYKNADWTVELCGRFRTTMADPVKEDDYCSKAERKDK